jgi:osmotically-inducible protein OsmY
MDKKCFFINKFNLLIITIAIVLSGCSITESVSLTSSVLNDNGDRRSSGEIIDDKKLKFALEKSIKEDEKLKNTNIAFMVYNKNVLIAGKVPNDELLIYVDDKVKSSGAKKIYNELQVGPKISLINRSKDSFITFQIESRFGKKKEFNPVHVLVTTKDKNVYLMGAVLKSEADQATEIVSTVKGVKKIVKLFEYLKHRPKSEIEQERKKQAEKERQEKIEKRKLILEAQKADIQKQLEDLEK